MPDYSYLYKFPGGTPTLDSKKFTEDSRQFDASLRDAQEARKAEALQAARDRMDANKQWAADYALKRQETDYLTSKPYYESSGGGARKLSNAEIAQGFIQRNMPKFKTANDMYAQVIRNMRAGAVDYPTGNNILTQLKTMYPDDIV